MQPPYTLVEITPKQVQLNKTTNEWNLSFSTLEEIEANPFTTTVEGTVITVVAELHHITGSSYYLENPNNFLGYNFIDCNDYTPPPDPPPVAKLPSGALNIPLARVKLYIRRDVPNFSSPDKAALHNDPYPKDIHQGSYFTDLTKQGMLRIVVDDNQEHWINPTDNIDKPLLIEPEKIRVEPKLHTSDFKASFTPFVDNKGYAAEDYYVGIEDSPVINFMNNGKPDKKLLKGQHIWICGVFTEDDILYGLPTAAADKDLWFGVFMSRVVRSDALNSATTIEERQVLHRITIRDHLTLIKIKLKRFFGIVNNKEKK